MKKTLIIHDLAESDFEKLDFKRDCIEVIYADGKYAPCQGCFGCWLKTPGKCVLKDALKDIGPRIVYSDEVIIISKNCYGGFCSKVKNVIDRGISISLPFFTYRAGRIHHVLRYGKKKVSLIVCLYGLMTPLEKETAQKLVHATEVNGCYRSSKLLTASDSSHIQEVLQ